MTNRPPIWFNASYVATSEALTEVVGKVVQRLPRERDSNKVRRQIEALLCNCIAASAWGDGSFHIPMDNNADYFKPGNPYRHPEVEKGTLPGLVRELTSLDCLELVEEGSQVTASVSRYGPGSGLKETLRECGPSDLGLDHKGPVVFLRERAQRDWANAAEDRGVANKPFDLEDPDNRALSDEVHDYNGWAETFEFSIDGAKVAPKGCRYYRLFLDGFLEHGRLYGHPIVTFPREARALLKIGGESLVELDITASLATIAYAKQSEFRLTENPYVVPAVEAAYRECGWPADDIARIARKCVKKVVVQRLCDNGPRKSYWLDEPGEEPFPWPRAALDCPTLVGLVTEHLPALAHYIQADRTQPPAGLGLMREEADIMLSALKRLRHRGLMALLVHDAIFVRRGDYRAAGLVLAQSFYAKTGVWPAIKATDFRSPQEAAYHERNGLKMVSEWLRSRTGKAPAWPQTLDEKLLSYRRQYQRPRDQAVQALARRLVAAWKHYKHDYLRTITGPWPNSILSNALLAAAISYVEMETAGADTADAEAAIRNGLRKMVVEDTSPQGRRMLGEDLTQAGFPDGYWKHEPPSEAEGEAQAEAI